MSLRIIQREAVLEALRWGHSANSNTKNQSSSSSSTELTSAWRVLVLDIHAQEVIAPLLKVKELRELAGVTLHLRLDKPRQAVAGAPAIYMCMPTDANVDQIAQDVEEALFSEYRIQFLATAPRAVLERLAKGLQNVSSIHNVFVADRALNFVALQGDLFTVPHADRICYAFNSKHLSEKDLEQQIRVLAQSLSHVAASLSPSAPFVSYMKSSAGGAAEAVAQKLHATLHDHVKERTYFASSNSPSKTVVLIVDRMADLSTALHHHFSYRSLLCDALDMKLNKIVVSEGKGGGGNGSSSSSSSSSSAAGDKKQLEVDPETDQFWSEHSERDFRTVHEYVDAAIASYQKEYQALMASEGVPSTGDSSADLAHLMQKAPKLADRKRSVDTHVLLAFQCLQAIKTRHLDELHGVEQALLHPSSISLDNETLQKLLDPHRAEYQGVLSADRERLLLMCYLAGTGDQGAKFGKELLAYVERHLSNLETANARVVAGGGDQSSSTDNTSVASSSSSKPQSLLFPALAYLKKLRSFSSPVGGARSSSTSSSSSSGWGFATEFFSKLTGGDKNACPVTRVADTIYQKLTSSSSSSTSGSSNSSNSDVVFLDPRSRDSSAVNESVVRSAGVNHLVVFVVGGVSPIEYEDLLKWSESKAVAAGGLGSSMMSAGGAGSTSGSHHRSTSAAVNNSNTNSNAGGWSVTVGGTEVLTGASLLSQLTELGRE